MRNQRDIGVDGWRTIAALSIVLLHATVAQAATGSPSLPVSMVQTICQWGVPFFFVAGGFFQGLQLDANGGGPPASEWVPRRAGRILPPYLAWSAIYLLTNAGIALVQRGSLPEWNPLSVIFLGGADPPLWYLPAMLYSGILVAYVRWSPAMPLALLLDAVFLFIDNPITNNILVSRLPMAVALTLLGFELSRLPRPSRRLGRLCGIVAISLLVAASSVEYLRVADVELAPAFTGALSYARMRFPWIAGALLFLVARSAEPSLLVSRMSSLAKYGLGVYLSHMLFLKMCALAVPPASTSPIIWVAVAFPIATVGALTFAIRLSKTPPLRRFVV